MELADLSDSRRQPESSREPKSGLRAWIKRNAEIVFVLETVAVVVLAILYFFSVSRSDVKDGPAKVESLRTSQQVEGSKPRIVKNFTLDFKVVATLEPDLVPGCNQRVHDLQYSVKCFSNNTSDCLTKTFDNLRATVVTTSKSGARFAENYDTIKAVKCLSDADLECRYGTRLKVYLDDSEQRILGWGGALTDSSINTILSLTTNGTRQLLDDYFGNDGLRFNMIRITMGGSDFSSRFYTNDDLDDEQDDLELKRFRLVEEDLTYKLPMLKLIQEDFRNKYYRHDKLKIFVSMWSPPIWMKSNQFFNKGYLKGSTGTTLKGNKADSGGVRGDRYFRALAELKRKFLLAYDKESIEFWGITVMNEPIFSLQPYLGFNTMIFAADDYARYLKDHLGPMLKDDPRLKHIKILVHDDNRRLLQNYTRPLMKDPIFRSYVDGVSVHGYIDLDYWMMSDMYKEFQEKGKDPLIMLPSELCSAHLPTMEKALAGNWNRGIHYGLDIIKSLQNQAAGWVDWNMVLDSEGGPGWLGGRLDSPILVDKQQDMYHKSPMFYVLGQFSRYIHEGSVRLSTQITNDHFDYQFETVTFKLGKTLITVVVNNNPYPINLNIEHIDGKSTTSEQVLYQVECPADSVSTIRYDYPIQAT